MNVPVALGLMPLLIVSGALLIRSLKILRWVGALGGVGQVLITFTIALPVLRGEPPISFQNWFQLDGMAAWILCVNSIVFAAALTSAALLLERPDDLHLSPRGARALFALGAGFIVAANMVVCAADLGAMWVAMEGTTLVTGPLIMLTGSRKSIEAAWKYLILCGVGIAFALLGSVILLAAAGETPGGHSSLNIVWLTAHVGGMKRSLVATSSVLFALGYGTKAGLFPVHNWLPDAHSEAPAPASALLSGALLNCAMVALWRIGGIIAGSTVHGFLVQILAPMGAVTVVAAAFMLIRQREMKRMWAYSSIENMGLLAICVGLRAAPIFALHALAHSLSKSSAFLLSGNLIRGYGSSSFEKLSGVLRGSPRLGVALICAGAAVMGAPPFASFVSEWLLIARASGEGQWWIVGAVVIGLAISVVAVLIHLGHVVFGDDPAHGGERRSCGVLVPAAILLFASAAGFLAVTPAALSSLDQALQGAAR